MTGTQADERLVEVVLLRLSLPAYREASEHHDELRREFALMAQGPAAVPAPDVPSRLVALGVELERRFQAFSSQPQAELDTAVARGDERIDLRYRIPPEAGPAAAAFDALLDEADAYCRAGDGLLTLATPPRAAAFRRWLLGEFVRQIDGLPPTPWEYPEEA